MLWRTIYKLVTQNSDMKILSYDLPAYKLEIEVGRPKGVSRVKAEWEKANKKNISFSIVQIIMKTGRARFPT